MAKKKKPKLSYELIQPESEVGAPMYELLHMLVDAHHEHLTHAKIALAFNRTWNSDTDGRITLGKCKKVSQLDRELHPYDFVIIVSEDFWINPQVTPKQRQALLDHELMHAGVRLDADGDPKLDAKGRILYRIRKHDLEEFRDIGSRYGCWKGDLEEMYKALREQKDRPLLLEVEAPPAELERIGDAIEKLRTPAPGVHLKSMTFGGTTINFDPAKDANHGKPSH